MRIALTHPWCWPHVQRGGERLFAELADYLARAGHEVVTVSAGPIASIERRTSGVEAVVHRIGDGVLSRFVHDQAVAYLPKAARTLREWRPDVVHGMYHLDGVAARLAGRHPYVVHIQGIARRAALAGKPLQRRLFHASIAKASTVVAVSEAGRHSLHDEFGIDSEVLHNGVDTAPFVAARSAGGRSETPSVLFPGDPDDPRKRVDVLIRSLNRMAPRWPGLRLLIASQPSPTTAAHVLDLSEVPVEFIGVTDPNEMPHVFARSWVTCNPAVREAFGLVFVEAMAVGVPAVGVDDGGVREVVPDERWLARPDDVVSLVAALECALADAENPATAARCQDRAAQFDWTARGPAFERLYADVLDDWARTATHRRPLRRYSR